MSFSGVQASGSGGEEDGCHSAPAAEVPAGVAELLKQAGEDVLLSPEAKEVEAMMLEHPLEALRRYTNAQEALHLCMVAQNSQRREDALATGHFVLQALSFVHSLVIAIVTTTLDPRGLWERHPSDDGKQVTPSPALLGRPSSSGLRSIVHTCGQCAAQTQLQSRARWRRWSTCADCVCVCVCVHRVLYVPSPPLLLRSRQEGQSILESELRCRSVYGTIPAERGRSEANTFGAWLLPLCVTHAFTVLTLSCPCVSLCSSSSLSGGLGSPFSRVSLASMAIISS